MILPSSADRFVFHFCHFLRQQGCLLALFLIAGIIFTAGVLCSSEKTVSANFVGPFYFRLPGFRSFVLQQNFSGVPSGSLATVRPDVQNPLATDSKMLIGSYTVTMLPGASIKISDRGFVPLAGRFIISGEGDEPLMFISRAYELHYKSGRLLLEVTPDDGTFIALRNKGDAFVKSLNRSIYDLEAGQEIHFPLFGEARLKKRISGFWSDPPTGFSAARRRPDSTSMAEENAEKAEAEDEDEDEEDEEEETEDKASAEDVDKGVNTDKDKNEDKLTEEPEEKTETTGLNEDDIADSDTAREASSAD